MSASADSPPRRLSRAEVERELAARPEGGWVDLRETDLRGVDLSGLSFERVIFGSHEDQSRRPALLSGARLRDARLHECKLADLRCVNTYFRGAEIRECDLRYAAFERGSFEDSEIVSVDLYRASFEGGVIFNSSQLAVVSLNSASLEGIIGLRPESLGGPDGLPGLAQEDPAHYVEFLRRTEGDRRDAIDDAVRRRLGEAALTYRALAGLWEGQGLFADAAWAYVRAKRLERRAASPFSEERPTSIRRWLGLGAADALCRFGESLPRVLIWIAAVAILPTLAYWGLDEVRLAATGAAASLGDCLLYSVGRIATATPERLEVTTGLAEWIGILQTLFGIALLGLLGFVLGNRLRGS